LAKAGKPLTPLRSALIQEYTQAILSVFDSVKDRPDKSLSEQEWIKVQGWIEKLNEAVKGCNRFELARVPRLFEMIERFKVFYTSRKP
jgi:hypothetical protein